MKQPMMNRDIKLENTDLHSLTQFSDPPCSAGSIHLVLHPLILTSSIQSVTDNTLPPVKRERSL